MSRFPKFLFAMLVLVFVIGFITSSAAYALDEDFDDEEPLANTAALASTQARREYAGARDEQNLEVQAGLPIPTRAIDGQVSIRLPSDSDADSSHD